MRRGAKAEAIDGPSIASRRVQLSGLVALLAIGVFTVVGLRPTYPVARNEAQAAAGNATLARLDVLRTSLDEWRFFLDALPRSTGSVPDPTVVGKATALEQRMAVDGRGAVSALHALGLASDAAHLAATNAVLSAAIARVPAFPADGSIAAVGPERVAVAADWTATGTIRPRVSEVVSVAVRRATDAVATARRTAQIAAALAAAATVGITLVASRRARREEQHARLSRRRRNFETTMQQALEMVKSEPDVYRVLTEALQASTPDLQVEMLVADSSRAHFHQMLDTSRVEVDGVGALDAVGPRDGCGVVSPIECPAARAGHTLVFPTSRAIDACPHLRRRSSGACSAVCVAVSLAGRSVGVLHATGVDGRAPSPIAIDELEITSRRAAERIAMLRAFERSEAQARSDPLTGLWNRRSIEARVHELHQDATPYALAYGDLDYFKSLNDTQGHDAGDQALRVFARVLRDSVRPNDLTARYGGEEFVLVLPNCDLETATSVLDRLRERLALTLNSAGRFAFTVSFGVALSTDGATFDAVVAAADRALMAAKAAGRDRVVRTPDLVAGGAIVAARTDVLR